MIKPMKKSDSSVGASRGAKPKPNQARGGAGLGEARGQFEDQLPPSRKMEAMGRLAEGAAHDFNNILSAALMHLGLLQQSTELTVNTRESLREIDLEVRRAASLARQLLLCGQPPPPQVVPLEITVSTSASRAGEIKGGSETILLVEDDPSVRRTAALCLRKLGYAVLEAGNGPEALKVWEQHRQNISLLITDMAMPNQISGLDLAGRFKKEKNALKIIIFSGYSMDSPEFPANALKRVAYLAKPCDPAAMAKAVRRCLDEPADETA
jgi:CheY-like chemotaxis protein